jgi:hypothetical protein
MRWWLAGLILMSACGTHSDGRGDGGAQTRDVCTPPLPQNGPFCEGGSQCTLPNGAPGTCAGFYGCVDATNDPNHCGGDFVRCAPGGACVAGTCLYATCDGSNVNGACSLPGGGRGVCCKGACTAIDFRSDPKNCGGCGIVCASDSVCNGGGCAVPCNYDCPGGASTCGTCPSGYACGSPVNDLVCGGLACQACLLRDCANAVDGTPCTNGICCDHSCIQPNTDPKNCGGCGLDCCGARCSGGSCLT